MHMGSDKKMYAPFHSVVENLITHMTQWPKLPKALAKLYVIFSPSTNISNIPWYSAPKGDTPPRIYD